VSDTGLGFDSLTAEFLFQPFEQAARQGDHRFGGLGLGLAIARAITELHGGTIRAESSGPGLGATFSVELPGAVSPRAIAISQTGTHGRAEAADEPALRLLVVEDHQATLQVLTRLLVRAGHSVVPASSVAEARAAAKTQSFDGVISDLGLPDGTGLELMAHLRAAYGLRGVVLSGYGMEDDLRGSQEAGFVVHLVKPVDFPQLRHALREISLRT
jgi:CheY-like chemotaxis protein